jgi:hypothetical protein
MRKQLSDVKGKLKVMEENVNGNKDIVGIKAKESDINKIQNGEVDNTSTDKGQGGEGHDGEERGASGVVRRSEKSEISPTSLLKDRNHPDHPHQEHHVRFALSLTSCPDPKVTPVNFTPVVPYCTSNSCRAKQAMEEVRAQFIKKCQEVSDLKCILAEFKDIGRKDRSREGQGRSFFAGIYARTLFSNATNPLNKPSATVQPLKPAYAALPPHRQCPHGHRQSHYRQHQQQQQQQQEQQHTSRRNHSSPPSNVSHLLQRTPSKTSPAKSTVRLGSSGQKKRPN